MVSHSRPILDPMQIKFQFGYTCGCSPIYAALMLTEIIVDAEDSKSELYVTLMDNSKAFDVVNHKGRLNALHEQGIHGNLWKLYDSLNSNITSVVKWRGERSEPFDEKQGIRQGGTPSADKYKSGKNKLLHHLDPAYSNDCGHLHWCPHGS